MKKHSLPKRLLLKKNDDFNQVFARGKRFQSTYFSAVVLHADNFQVGFTTKKGMPSKPARNYLKRLGRELWRRHFRNYPLTAKIVIIVQQHARYESFSNLEQDFKNLLNRMSEQGLTK